MGGRCWDWRVVVGACLVVASVHGCGGGGAQDEVVAAEVLVADAVAEVWANDVTVNEDVASDVQIQDVGIDMSTDVAVAMDVAPSDPLTGTDAALDALYGDASRVLIHYGHGGIDRDGIYGYGAHVELESFAQNAGLIVDYSAVWPDSLEDHRLVVLALPGCMDETVRFLDEEVAALDAYLSDGGWLYIENDKEFYNGTATINDLLMRLGHGMRQASDTIGTGGGYFGVMTTDITNSVLTAGIDQLGFGEASRVIPNDATCLVRYEGNCLMAFESHGAGMVIASGDQQFIDDHAMTKYLDAGGDNVQLVRNLLRL